MKNVLKIFSILFIALLLFMGISYIYATVGIEEMNDEVRTSLNKEFVQLKQGAIHYGWSGPVDGEVLVMIHGFSTPRFVFMKNVGALADAGYRVFTYDHYGRGYSDRPAVDYDKTLYDEELLELLDALKIAEPINLVGYSMGGGIATVFTAMHPERVKKLVLMSPVGFIPKQGGVNSLLSFPIIGKWLMTVIGKNTLIDEFDKHVANGDAPKEMADGFKEQFQYAGVEQAFVSTIRNYPMSNMESEYKQLGKTRIPKLMIWGAMDTVCPITGAATIARLVPGIQLFTIEDGKHEIAYSHADIVNRALIEFFNKY